MLQRGSLASKVVVGVVGGLLVAGGVALLVLPGPGILLVAAGLAVLAREYAWAARPLRIAKERGQDGLDLIAEKWWVAVGDVLSGLVLVAVAVVDLTVDLPLIGWFSDAFILLGGLFLLGSVVYARRSRPDPA